MSKLAKLVFVLTVGPDIRCAFTGPLVLWLHPVTWNLVYKVNDFYLYLPVVDTIVSLRLFQVHFDLIPLLSLDLCYQPGSILLQIYLDAHTNVY